MKWEKSNTLACSQELGDLRKESESPGEISQPPNLLKLTPTLKPSCDRTTPLFPSTPISKTFPPELENLTSTQLGFPALEPAPQVTELDSTTQNQACGLKPCGASLTANPTLPSSKILRGLSAEDYEQFLEDSEFADIVGTIHKSFQQRNSERRTKGSVFLSLPTPTTYARGSTGSRPAGATRLEQSLRKFIAKGDKLHPAVPGWMMGFRPGWVEETLMAGGQATHIQLPFIPECVTTQPSDAKQTTSTPGQSVLSKPRSQSAASSTSTHCLKRQPSGWLEHYFKNKKLKDGTISTFPKVEGYREADNPEHWYWAYKWEERNPKALSPNGYITRAVSVPSNKVYQVRYAIASRWNVPQILQLIKGEK